MILDGGAVTIGLESTIVDLTEEIPTILRPGFISLDMVQAVLGEAQIDRGLIANDSNIHPKAPGMKYRHYAPKADLKIVEGPMEQVISYINGQAEKGSDRHYLYRGEHVPVILKGISNVLEPERMNFPSPVICLRCCGSLMRME